jgi:hypothetical protein
VIDILTDTGDDSRDDVDGCDEIDTGTDTDIGADIGADTATDTLIECGVGSRSLR